MIDENSNLPLPKSFQDKTFNVGTMHVSTKEVRLSLDRSLSIQESDIERTKTHEDGEHDTDRFSHTRTNFFFF